MKNQNIKYIGSESGMFKESTLIEKSGVSLEKKSLFEITQWIATDTFKIEIYAIQSLMAGDKIKETKLTTQVLQNIKSSTNFKEIRLLNQIAPNIGIIQLDYDKLTSEKLEKAFKIISQCPYSILCYCSSSGKSFNVFAEVYIGNLIQIIAYCQLKQYYENETSFKADDECKDLTRYCFIYYDPHIYRNIDFKKFMANIPVSNLSNN